MVGLGKQIHDQIIKQDLQSYVYINSDLVDMYSKGGNMQNSRLTIENSLNRDFVTWDGIVCAYTNHGLGKEALLTFKKLQLQNIRPNHATFVAVLHACAHICLVERGLFYFNSMQTDNGLDPQLEHYSSIVDILGISGQVTDALTLY